MKKTAIYPGTFDPITYGHVDVIQKSLKIVENLIVAVSDGSQKNYLFSIDERIQIVNKALFSDLKFSKNKIKVISFNSLTNGDYHAVVRFYTQGGGMYGDFTNYRFPETDPVLTWNYIESPDGVFHYPLFSTTEEAEFADIQEGGTGTYHNHVFVDDTSNTVWYMPDSLMYHDESSAPNGNTLGSFTDIVWNEIPTGVDSNYKPTPFSPQTIYVNEGDSVNLQIVPADACSSFDYR